MAKITKINDGDTGSVARANINEALKDITDESIVDLIDVVLFNPSNEEVLSFDNGTWKNKKITGTGAVNSVDGRTGIVTLDDLYSPIEHTHTESDIIDLDKYTKEEVDIAIQEGSGIADAPQDGTPYSRQDAGWVAASTGGGAVSINDLTDVNITGISNDQILLWNDAGFIAGDIVNPGEYVGKDVETIENPDPENPAETGDVKSITDIVNHLFTYASSGKQLIIDAGKTVSLPMEDNMSFKEIADVILSIDSVSFTITGQSVNNRWKILQDAITFSNSVIVNRNLSVQTPSTDANISEITHVVNVSSEAKVELI